ncbi:cell division protein FtsQ/DivIB [Croceiramulus getboli]|nr:hypothetical protein P8624_01630 [Flavobacteriaceae bacterium YJPT1-3]
MKKQWGILKVILALILACGLWGFSSFRNEQRKIRATSIEFVPGQDPFVTFETVNKLLIQSSDSLQGRPKEILDLKELESRVDAHPMIAKGEVYVTVDGALGVRVDQRTPLARISTSSASYYLDKLGEKMPLSTNFSARVPVVTGVSEQHLSALYTLADFINRDVFLKKQIVGIARQSNGDYVVTPRVLGYDIIVGKSEFLERKFKNYKAFYEKARKDETLTDYRLVDLRFSNQVIGTKK